jgi:hypothetical protein
MVLRWRLSKENPDGAGVDAPEVLVNSDMLLY